MRIPILFVARTSTLVLDYTLGTIIVMSQVVLAGRRRRMTQLPTAGIEFSVLH